MAFTSSTGLTPAQLQAVRNRDTGATQRQREQTLARNDVAQKTAINSAPIQTQGYQYITDNPQWVNQKQKMMALDAQGVPTYTSEYRKEDERLRRIHAANKKARLNQQLQGMPEGGGRDFTSGSSLLHRSMGQSGGSGGGGMVGTAGAAQANIGPGQTSAGQLEDIIRANSGLMQQARTSGMQSAAARGLLNSSMAAGAAQDAMIRNASPLAMQDAATYADLARFNAGEANKFGLQRNQYGFDRGLADQRYGHQRGLADQSYGHQRGLNSQTFGFNTALADQGYGHDLGRAQQAYGFNRGLAEQGYGFQRGINEQQAGIQAERDERLSGLDQEMAQLQAGIQEARDSRLFGQEQELREQASNIQRERDQLLFDQTLESMQQEYGYRGEMATQEAENRMRELYATSNANAWGLMSDNLTDIVGQYSSQIDAIQQNPNITPENKTRLIEDQRLMRDTDIEFQKELYEGFSQNLLDTNAFPDMTARA